MARGSFGIDHIIVERRPIPPSRPFHVFLPKPVSVNAMYGQAPGRKRFHSAKYAAWIEEAVLRLRAARPPNFKGRVWVTITCEDTGPMDLDNAAKSVLDLAVREGVIEDDGRQFVREIRLAWGNVSGCRLDIQPFPFGETRAAA